MGHGFNAKEILVDGVTFILTICTSITPLVWTCEDTARSCPSIGTLGFFVSVTTLFLAGRLVTYLSAISRFGFVVSMLFNIVKYSSAFLFLLFIAVGCFGVIFHTLPMSDPNEGLAAVLAGERTVKHGSMGGAGMKTELWRMYRLAILGDFDPDMYGMNTAYTIAFLVMTVMINIIMMNVLISLVSEGFGETNKRKQQESRITRALKIVELEATFTAGYMVHWQSGPTFHVTRFPSILLGDGVMQRRPGKGKGVPKQQDDGADNAENLAEGEAGEAGTGARGGQLFPPFKVTVAAKADDAVLPGDSSTGGTSTGGAVGAGGGMKDGADGKRGDGDREGVGNESFDGARLAQLEADVSEVKAGMLEIKTMLQRMSAVGGGRRGGAE